MIKKMKVKKGTALLLTGVLAISGIIAAIGATLAATPINWTATVPEGAPANVRFHVDAAGLKDEKGKELSVSASGVSTWGSSDATIARVKGRDEGKGTYLAVKPGVFVAYRSTLEGQLGGTAAMVYDSTKPYTYTVAKNHSVIKDKGGMDTIPLTMKDMNDKEITDAVVWSSDDTSVATVHESTGTITAVGEEGLANIAGKFTDCYGQPQKIQYSVVVGRIVASDVVGPDGNGKYWTPMEAPKNIWREADEDGNPKEPASYIYDENDPLTGEDSTPTIKGEDGKYYVELEDSKNIYEPVKEDGTIDEGTKIWGGLDFKPGNEDDKEVKNFGTKTSPDYWADFNENIYGQISRTTGKTSTLTGGGIDEDPLTDPVKPILDNTATDGHYYFGPLTDSDGVSYYIGDDWKEGGAGDGILNTDHSAIPHSSDLIYYRNEDGSMDTEKPVTEIPASSIVLGTPVSDTIGLGEKEGSPSITVLPNDTTNQTVAWSSSDTSVATVDADTGEVTGVADGTATITATITNKNGTTVASSYAITVKDPWGGIGKVPGETFTASGKEWTILKVDGNGNALVITKYLQGISQFNSTDAAGNAYVSSTLRTTMNNFYNTLETSDTASKNSGERAKIWITDLAQPSNFLNNTPAYNVAGGLSAVDLGGLKTCFPLSYQEANTYFSSDAARVAYQEGASSSAHYWLRSPGSASYNAADVHSSGALYDTYTVRNALGVRPALWIKLP